MIEVTADSASCKGMDPEIMPDDKLIIEPYTHIDESKICLVCVGDEQKICRVLETACGVWLIFSNPVYHPEFIPMEKMGTFKIVGRIAKQVRNY